MATATFDTYDAAGIREDLQDQIWDQSPTDTPICSAIAKTSATATNHEFQTNRIEAPARNINVEGADAGTSDATPTNRLGNYTEIADKVALVSGTMESVTKAGRASEMSYQIANMMLVIKTDVEFGVSGRAAGAQVKFVGDDTTAREQGAVQAYLSTNFVSAGTAAAGTPPAGPFPDGSAGPVAAGTPGAFTEDFLKTALQSAYDNGSKCSMMVVSAVNKGIASGFDGGTTRYNTAEDKKLVASIDVYVGDFHTLEIVPSRIINSTDVIGIDPEYMELAELRPMFDKELGDTGDSWRRQVLWEGCVAVTNEQAHFVVSDTTG